MANASSYPRPLRRVVARKRKLSFLAADTDQLSRRLLFQSCLFIVTTRACCALFLPLSTPVLPLASQSRIAHGFRHASKLGSSSLRHHSRTELKNRLVPWKPHDTRCSSKLTAESGSSQGEHETPKSNDSADSSLSLSLASKEISSSSKTYATSNTTVYEWTKPTFDLALPALIGMIADPLLSLMDTFFTAKLGSIPLAALGACTSIFHLAFNAFRATTAATTSLVANALGRTGCGTGQILTLHADFLHFCASHGSQLLAAIESSDNKTECKTRAQMVLSTSVQFSTFLGAVVSFILYTFSKQALNMMGIAPSSALYPHATTYLRIRALAAPAVLFITVSEGAFRGYSDTKTPLLASIVASVVNIVMDPIMMFAWGMGVGGAAAATALAQVFAAGVYFLFIQRRRMLLPPKRSRTFDGGTINGFSTINGSRETSRGDVASVKPNVGRNHTGGGSSNVTTKAEVILAIIQANVAMMLKQGSLLLAWAYATSRATRLGHEHVAAHQVALSFWLVFALVQDGAAVAAQVLMSQTYATPPAAASAARDEDLHAQGDAGVANRRQRDVPKVRSLTGYMLRFAVCQSMACAAAVYVLGRCTPYFFSRNDAVVAGHLRSLIPTLTAFQPLVGLTLVLESLAVGGNLFNLLAVGTTLSTVASMWMLHSADSIVQIWQGGLVTLFVGRLLTALVGVASLNDWWGVSVLPWTSRLSRVLGRKRRTNEAERTTDAKNTS